MMSGTIFNQRDIVSVPFMYSGLDGQKYRPALILSNKSYNISNNDFLCCAITGNLTQQSRGILIKNENLDEGVLAKESVLIPPHIVNIKKKLIKKKWGVLKKEKVEEVLKFLNLQISLD